MSKKFTSILVGIPSLSGAVSSVAIVAKRFIKNDDNISNQPQKKIDSKKDEEAKSLSIFPEFHNEDFYNEIKVKNGAPFFDEDFIAKIVMSVIGKIIIPEGKIAWNYRFLDNLKTKLALRFEWRVSNNIYMQPQAVEYLFELTKN